MRKFKLDLESLTVESFAPEAAAGPHEGTVHGHAHTLDAECTVTAYSGRPDCVGCQVSGNATCVLCPGDTETCMECSYTNGEAFCAW